MDALYFLRHSRSGDLEIRYSLRALARYLPGVRKVWVFGDRPAFLSGDTALVEHVPHEYVARVGNFRTPVTAFFLMYFVSSLIPEIENAAGPPRRRGVDTGRSARWENKCAASGSERSELAAPPPVGLLRLVYSVAFSDARSAVSHLSARTPAERSAEAVPFPEESYREVLRCNDSTERC